MRALFGIAALLICSLVQAATCSVTEFKEAPPVTYQGAVVPAVTSYVLTYTTSSVASNAFNYYTRLIRLECDNIAFATFATTPTATTTSMRLAAGVPEYFTVPPNSGLKVAVIGQ